MPYADEVFFPETSAQTTIFEELWGEYRSTVLKEMNRAIKDWIELSGFDPKKKEFLRKRYIQGSKLSEILQGAEYSEFETQRKWICRQGKKIACSIALKILPALIDCYRIPISKKIDPKLIETHLLGFKTKAVL